MDARKEELIQRIIVCAQDYDAGILLFKQIVAEALGLHVTDVKCLGLILHKGFATPSELSSHTGLSSGATTFMLDRLERAGLIERRPNPQDRRSAHIVVTKKTTDTVMPLFASVRNAQAVLASSYSKQELELFITFFEKSIALWETERHKLKQRLTK